MEEFHVFLSRGCASWFVPMHDAVYLGDKLINTILCAQILSAFCAQVLSAFRTVWLLEKEDAIVLHFSPLQVQNSL